MTSRRWLILALMLWASSGTAEDTLDKAKEELHPPKPRSSSSGGSTSPKPQSSSYDHSSSFDDDEDDDDGIIGALLGVLFEGIGHGIHACFCWPGDDTATMGVARYPYHDDWNGWYAPYGRAAQPGRLFGGELSAEGGWIEDDLQRYTIGGRVMVSAFVLRSEWSRYIEERDDGSHNTLNVGTIDAELGITLAPSVRLGVGAGATITHDSTSTEAGPCVVLGLDVFPIRPAVLTGVMTYGKVGEWGTEILTLRGTVGAVWQRYELYGGWQSTRIGDVRLDGPTAGLRLWF